MIDTNDVSWNICLDDEVWTLAHISIYMRISINGAKKLVADSEFPQPIYNSSRNRRWLSREVKEFIAMHRPTKDIKPILNPFITDPNNFHFSDSKKRKVS